MSNGIKFISALTIISVILQPNSTQEDTTQLSVEHLKSTHTNFTQLIPLKMISILQPNVTHEDTTQSLDYLNSTHTNFTELIHNVFIAPPPDTQDNTLKNATIEKISYPIERWNKDYVNMAEKKFPPPFNIKFSNFYWQVFHADNIIAYLFNAYLDDRALSQTAPSVRILMMMSKPRPVSLCCQFWFDNLTEPVSTMSDESNLIWREYWRHNKNDSTLLPYLWNCPIPIDFKDLIPISVSVADENCQGGTNNLKVIYEKPTSKKEFAVCVKGLDFPFQDNSVTLIEWIEFVKLLGVDKIYIYKFAAHPNVEKIFDYYINNGIVDVTPITYSDGKPHLLRVAKDFRQNVNRFEQLISYNDCWNRNIYKYKYISLLDVDEIIMPVAVDTWPQLMQDIELRHKNKSSYVASEVRFHNMVINTTGIPSYMRLMRRIIRNSKFNKIGHQSKSIHDTEKVLTVHNHYFISSFLDEKSIYEMNTSEARLYHFRNDNDQNPILKISSNHTIDVSHWKYIKRLKENMAKVLSDLNLLEST